MPAADHSDSHGAAFQSACVGSAIHSARQTADNSNTSPPQVSRQDPSNLKPSARRSPTANDRNTKRSIQRAGISLNKQCDRRIWDRGEQRRVVRVTDAQRDELQPFRLRARVIQFLP